MSRSPLTDYVLHLPLLPEVTSGVLVTGRVLDTLTSRQLVQLGMVRSGTVPLETASPAVRTLRGNRETE